MSKVGSFDQGAALAQVAAEELPARAAGRATVNRNEGLVSGSPPAAAARPAHARRVVFCAADRDLVRHLLRSLRLASAGGDHRSRFDRLPASRHAHEQGRLRRRGEGGRSRPQGPAQRLSVEPDLSAGAARSGGRALHLVHHPAADQGFALAASEPVAQHSGHLLGFRYLVHLRRSDRGAVRHLCRFRAAQRALHRVLPLSAGARLWRTRGRHSRHL